MQGNNELVLNIATMTEAVQEWLDRRWNSEVGGPPPVVYTVRASGDTFSIKLKEADDE